MSGAAPGDWYAYFWPGTIVLRNRLGIYDPDELRNREDLTVEVRASEIRTGAHPIDRTFDAAHLSRIHAHLFGDLYDWAGHFRTVNISKATDTGAVHHFGDHSSMDMYLRQARALIARTAWAELEHSGLAERLADVHTRLNFAHPFRDGNGRTTRIFMQHLAQRAGRDLDFGRLGADEWIAASAATFQHPLGLRLDPGPLIEVYLDVLGQP
ncbi:MAG TPA: cell filamentation protein Fic [Actinomycetales bacterium]|nr:cell filamentation protein Fic [Actinomycetales bacterium]